MDKYINCKLCQDKGYILYRKTIDKQQYDHIAHCVCAKGNNYKYDGTKVESEDNKSEFYIPSIEEIDLNKCNLINNETFSFKF